MKIVCVGKISVIVNLLTQMVKWLLKKWYKHSPICNCGWAMKPFERGSEGFQWKCVRKSCGCEVFDNGNGKLHWFQGKESI